MAIAACGRLLGTAALLWALAGSAWADAASWDELPEGEPAEVARLYHSALALPGVGGWSPARRAALVDAATLRYRDRLVDRASSPSPQAGRRHLRRLAAADGVPDPVLAQACAQFGVLADPCQAHAGYVRRVLVIEEMLVQKRLALTDLEAELTGAARPSLGGAGQAW